MTSTLAADKLKSLNVALAQIEKSHGKGAVIKLTDRPAQAVDAIPTGSMTLDDAIGIGGVPRGRVTEIYGPESSGKTTLTLHLIANVQKAGGIAAFIDAEHALDTGYAAKIGVDLDALLLSQPGTGEQALDIVEKLVASGAVDLIVVDSVAALTPQAELDGEMGDQQMGLQARLMSKALRKLTGSVNSTNTALVFINQLREKIGVFAGPSETTTGGKALKFYASLRLDIRRLGAIKDKDEVVGAETRVKVVKNKVAPPFREARFEIMYNVGIDDTGSVLDMAVDYGIVQKSGAFYSYEGSRLAQGRENVKQFFKENPDVYQTVLAAVREKMLASKK